jgi:kynurenine formamidase
MGLSLLLQSPFPFSSSSCFIVPARVRHSIYALIAVDPIVDLPSLISEYPSYANFVEDAFGKDRTQWERASPARWNLSKEDSGDDNSEAEGKRDYLRILVLHSREDELLSLRQPRFLITQLNTLLDLKVDEEEGGGKEVGKRGSLEVDFESIRGKHEELPHTLILAQRVTKYVQELEREWKGLQGLMRENFVYN